MSLEQLIAENTAALKENTAALLAAGGGAKAETPAADAKTEKAATTKTTKAAKPEVKKPEPVSEHTREEMQAALAALKEAKGAPVAKGVIKDVGGVDKMADIGDDKIDAVYEAATAAIEDEDM